MVSWYMYRYIVPVKGTCHHRTFYDRFSAFHIVLIVREYSLLFCSTKPKGSICLSVK